MGSSGSKLSGSGSHRISENFKNTDDKDGDKHNDQYTEYKDFLHMFVI